MSNVTEIQFPEFETLDYLDQLSFQSVRWLYSIKYVSPQLVAPLLTVALALLIVTIGAYSTLAKPRDALDSNLDKDENPNWDPTDNDGSTFIKSSKLELELLNHESLSLLHAFLLPIMAGVTLYTLDYCLKNISKDKLMRYLNWYMLITCPFSHISVLDYMITATTRTLTHKLLGKNSSWIFKRYRLVMSSDAETFPLGVVEYLEASTFKKDDSWFQKFKIHLKEQGVQIIHPKTLKRANQPFSLVFDSKYLFSGPLALACGYLFYQYNPVLNSSYLLPSNNWLVTNLMGINFAIFGIKHLKISNFTIAYCLLVALFFYDIYFVFGNKIMIKVATGIDIPIKLCIPLKPSGDLYHSFRLSLLGLGDVALPGALISLCLRFDLSNFYKIEPLPFHHLNSFPTPYFKTSLVTYTAGLIGSYCALNYFKSGQPALLYIVPSMLLGITLMAYIRGESRALFQYSEHIEEFDLNKNEENDDKSMVLITTDEDTNEDDDYLYEDPNDSYDEWEAKVELKRLGTEDLHNLLEELIDDDDDDDTFLINSDQDQESGDEIDEIDIVEVDEIELIRLQNDLRQEPREWYSDDDEEEEEEEVENDGDNDDDDDDEEDKVYILQ